MKTDIKKLIACKALFIFALLMGSAHAQSWPDDGPMHLMPGHAHDCQMLPCWPDEGPVIAFQAYGEPAAVVDYLDHQNPRLTVVPTDLDGDAYPDCGCTDCDLKIAELIIFDGKLIDTDNGDVIDNVRVACSDKDCPLCGGSGKLIDTDNGDVIDNVRVARCPLCGGTGILIDRG